MRSKKLLEAQNNALQAIEGLTRELVRRTEDMEKRLSKVENKLDSDDERPEEKAQRLYLEGISNVLNYEVGVKVSGR